MTDTQTELQTLREAIDEIDNAILKLLGERFVCTRKIGVFKATHNLKAKSDERESAQFNKFLSLAKEYDLPFELVETIYRDILRQVVREHQTIARDQDSP